MKTLFTRSSQRGIVLVITLILLAIITFMAITLLVVTRSEKGAVVIQADQTTASLAADVAFERVKMSLIAPIMAFTNQYSLPDLLISTNYVNALGFIPNNSNLTNVNFAYTYPAPAPPAPTTPLTGVQSLQNLQNLSYDPRPPVFMTNRLAPPYGTNEFRYYLDLNRNKQFDSTGLMPVISADPTRPYYDTNGNTMPAIIEGNTLSNYFTGDPQWIGVLEKPGFPHSPTNQFVSRYAFMAIPLSTTLDVNYIHNYAKDLAVTMPRLRDGFFRNMGVGAWEINLAAFLVDLNTNLWQPGIALYSYDTNWPVLAPNTGMAFNHALDLLRYRYNANYQNLLSVRTLFGNSGTLAFGGDFVDGYTRGPLLTAAKWNPDRDPNFVNLGWAGSDNPNHFYTTQDFFDTNKVARNAASPTFVDLLKRAGTNSDSYSRYTFSRMAAQLGTESAPESGKLNLNYVNVDDYGDVVPNMATNFIPWTNALQFFTNVAVRLLVNSGYSVGTGTKIDPYSSNNILVSSIDISGHAVTNFSIQVWPTNFYTPSVHRLLQLAANIYDATTNRVLDSTSSTNGFPTVFQPRFFRDKQDRVFIVGFREVDNAANLPGIASAQMHDLNSPTARAALGPNKTDMAYGIPLVIGAKKGFPNFNEFSMETSFSVTRKLQFVAPTPRNPKVVRPTLTNQMFVVSISNVFGVEAWNSYSNVFPRPLTMMVATEMNAVVTNELGQVLNTPPFGATTNYLVTTNLTANNWNGFLDANRQAISFRVPLAPSVNHFLFLTNSTFSQQNQRFQALTGKFEQNQSPAFALPRWWLRLNTRLRFMLVDTGVVPNRIVDYVNLSSRDEPIDITYELMREGECSDTYHPPASGKVPDGMLWCTNRASPLAPTFGTRLQIDVSLGTFDADWRKSQSIFPGTGLNDQHAAIDFFRSNSLGWPPKYGSRLIYQTNIFYAPFAPTRTLYILTSWSANDPLVHYTVNDLEDLEDLKSTNHVRTDNIMSQEKISNIGRINNRYEPWGALYASSRSQSQTKFALQVKDPLVTRSDDWDFPTNKLPNIGWLGRVHRGTPWQTIYLKSPLVDVTNWVKWTGNSRAVTNFGQINTNIVNLPLTVTIPATNWTYDVLWTFPTNDWAILDLFTTAFNDNAARGRLPINQTNLAAWSAVFSGVIALQANTNGASGSTNFMPVVIQPVGLNGNSSPLLHLVNAINDVRRTNFAGSFRKLGDILAVPELTVNSPFLALTNVSALAKPWSVNDAVCERLPQQTLSLLTLDHYPRFLVYSWGQALKPANRSIITSGPFFKLCTNYQVTAETATRAVIRVEGVPDKPHVVVEKFNVLPPD